MCHLDQDTVRSVFLKAGFPERWCDCSYSGKEMAEKFTQVALRLRMPLRELVRRINDHPIAYVGGEPLTVAGDRRFGVRDDDIVCISGRCGGCHTETSYYNAVRCMEPNYGR